MRTPFAFILLAAITAPSAACADAPRFGREVTPLLYKLGCSSGQCHGAFSGKGGFRLSLFASDPEQDWVNLRGAMGRRLNPAEPDASLLLLKPSGAVAHTGGVLIEANGPEYKLLREWIVAGARYDAPNEPRPDSIRVEPATVVARKGGPAQPLRVFAKLSDGRKDEVTRFARFESLEPTLAAVDADGKVTAGRSGDAPVLAHYAGKIAYAIAVVPGELPAGLSFPKENLADTVDRMISDKLVRLNIVPSPACDDGEFLRRAHLDVIGILPLPDEVRAFVADKTPDKRAKLIEKLLAHPLHHAVWATKLCDLTGADDRFLGGGVYEFHDWFRNKLEANTPWDKLAAGVIVSTAADGKSADDLLTEQKRQAEERKKAGATPKKAGPAEAADPNTPPWRTGYATRNTLDVFYNNRTAKYDAGDKRGKIDSGKVSLRVAGTFLGVQLECAQCHKHPHDRWTQRDYYGFASVFAHVSFGQDPALVAKKVRIAGTHISETPVETFDDPRTGEVVKPRVLGGTDIEMKAGVDPREVVWKWMVSPENPYFARAIVNRIWSHYMGRGLIDPVDGQSEANPPSHPDVLAELVRQFTADKYDLRKLNRRILNTLAYQRSWRTNASNAHDERNYSHRPLRRMTAEQVLDAVAQVTGTPVVVTKKYGDVRPNTRAIELAVTRGGGDDGYVLQIFGKPLRVQTCECERSNAPSLSQVLYLYNDNKLNAKISDPKGRLTELLGKIADDAKLIEELHVVALGRPPTAAETASCLKYVKGSASRADGFQDVMWSLLNRDEFMVNH